MINGKPFKYSNVLGIILIVVIYFVFGYFTYYPPRVNLFYDYLNKIYGINRYS